MSRGRGQPSNPQVVSQTSVKPTMRMLIAIAEVSIFSRRVFGGQPTIFIAQRMYRALVLTVTLFTLACKGNSSSASGAPSRDSAASIAAAASAGELESSASSTPETANQSAPGTETPTPPAGTQTSPPSAQPGGGTSGAPIMGPGKPNLTGRIPVLEYHVIGGDQDALYTRTAAHYLTDLEEAYQLGYRPINISQMLDKN